MNESALLQHLEGIAEKLKLAVSYQSLRKLSIYSRGGLYRLKEEQVVLIETSLTLSEKIDTLADALSRFNLEHIAMPPLVRKIIDGKKTAGMAEEPADAREVQSPDIPAEESRADPDEIS
jgi:hypothetical protein